MNIWFTSDLHLGHRRVLEFCPRSRPYTTVEEMDAAILGKWEEQVKEYDTVWCLGDMSWYSGKRTLELLNELPGVKYLIWGNHDDRWRKQVSDTELYRVFHAVHDRTELNLPGCQVILDHYPLAEWRGAHRGSLHFHGHTHGNVVHNGRALDVGVDGPLSTGEFRLYSLEECRTYCEKRPLPKQHRVLAENVIDTDDSPIDPVDKEDIQ